MLEDLLVLNRNSLGETRKQFYRTRHNCHALFSNFQHQSSHKPIHRQSTIYLLLNLRNMITPQQPPTYHFIPTPKLTQLIKFIIINCFIEDMKICTLLIMGCVELDNSSSEYSCWVFVPATTTHLQQPQ